MHRYRYAAGESKKSSKIDQYFKDIEKAMSPEESNPLYKKMYEERKRALAAFQKQLEKISASGEASNVDKKCQEASVRFSELVKYAEELVVISKKMLEKIPLDKLEQFEKMPSISKGEDSKEEKSKDKNERKLFNMYKDLRGLVNLIQSVYNSYSIDPLGTGLTTDLHNHVAGLLGILKGNEQKRISAEASFFSFGKGSSVITSLVDSFLKYYEKNIKQTIGQEHKQQTSPDKVRSLLSLDSPLPLHIRQMHAARFKAAVQMSKNGSYLCHGRQDAKELEHSYKIRWPELDRILGKLSLLGVIIDTFINSKDECHICDIGGGEGHYLANLKNRNKTVRVLNLTADATHISADLDKSTEVTVWDMHDFSHSDKVKDREFEVIMSFNTLWGKTPDPLWVIMQLYEKLAENGVLYIDRFSLSDKMAKYREDIIKFLQNQGHEVRAVVDPDSNTISCLTLFKTSNKLIFPVYYAEPNASEVYTPSHELTEAHSVRMKKIMESKEGSPTSEESAIEYVEFCRENMNRPRATPMQRPSGR